MTQITGNVTATTLTYATAIVELLTNGDFETGALSPWQNLSATTTVATNYKSSLNGGNYGDYFSCNAGDVGGILQEFEVTANVVHSISFDYISDVGVVVGLGGSDLLTTDATDTWTNFSIDGPFISDEVELTNVTYCHLWTGRGGYVEIDNISIKGVVTTENISSATIEDSSKTWTADLLNDGTFILTSGDVQGYSTKILDTFGNYIQVATSFANIINNITSGTSLHTATVQTENPDFSTGDFTGWSSECTTDCTGDEFATIYITSSTKQSGSYAVCGELRAGDPTESTYFTLAPTAVFDVTDITYVSFYYNIINIVRGGDVYFQVSVATAGDGEGNPVIVSETYTAQTDGWLRGLLNVATLTGDAEMTIQGKCPLPDW